MVALFRGLPRLQDMAAFQAVQRMPMQPLWQNHDPQLVASEKLPLGYPKHWIRLEDKSGRNEHIQSRHGKPPGFFWAAVVSPGPPRQHMLRGVVPENPPVTELPPQSGVAAVTEMVVEPVQVLGNNHLGCRV